MKKFLLFLGVLLILIVPKSIYAENKEYFIDKLNIEAEILTNGDIVINELMEYRFNGDFNGVYRNLNLNGSEGYLINEISVIDSLGNTTKLIEENYGENNTYEINENSDETQIKIFSKSSDESKMFKLNYTIKGAAKKYSEYSNLYWNFYDVKNIDSVKEGSLKIHLKDTNFEIDKLIYDIYGDGEITTSNTEKIITINFKELTSLIGIDMKFQKDYLSMSKEIIIPEENNDYSNDYNNDFNNYYKEEKSDKYTSIVLILFACIGSVLGLFGLEKSKFNKEVNKYRENYIFTNEEFIMEPPSDLPPALVNLLINENNPSEEMLVTTLFYLANKGYYKMEEKDLNNKKKNNDLIFTRINENKEIKYSHLEYIIKWFSSYEVNGSFSMKQIKKITASNKGAKTFINRLENFLNKVREDGENLGFYIKIRNKNVLENNWYNEKRKWLAYKKYLQNIYKNNSINNDSLNDSAIIYALALEISDKELENIIKLSVDKTSLNNNSNSLNSFNYMNLNRYIFYMMMFNNMTNNAHEIVNPPTQTQNFNNSNDFFSGNDFNGGGGGDSGAF